MWALPKSRTTAPALSSSQRQPRSARGQMYWRRGYEGKRVLQQVDVQKLRRQTRCRGWAPSPVIFSGKPRRGRKRSVPEVAIADALTERAGWYRGVRWAGSYNDGQRGSKAAGANGSRRKDAEDGAQHLGGNVRSQWPSHSSSGMALHESSGREGYARQREPHGPGRQQSLRHPL